ncbi:hypothetical protein [Cetobacterium sp.]|uniref:hypothetical protein n=1 Tax=Cetobacterium sp. TaxID=2071632 RepID=UPI003EE62AC9
MKNNVLGRIQSKVNIVKTEEKQLAEYLSQFDFESFEIPETDKKFISEREAVFVKNGRLYADSLYEMCIALQEVKDRLTNNHEASFMAWYNHIGLNKDKVSFLLKRAQLYLDFPEQKAFISSLSDLAVRTMTAKGVLPDVQKALLESKVAAVKDIKEIAGALGEDNTQLTVPQQEFKYFSPKPINKIQKDIKNMSVEELMKAKRELEYYKKLMTTVIKELEVKEKEYENKDNLKLVEVE